ncbi:MAG: DUF4147 domain-containing protein [Patescibacteria group bacterium]|nr:DUF4147 domain-containing protein [Patescibacteria group bacterium]
MFIKNKKELSTTKYRKIILELIETAVKSVAPKNLMRGAISYNDKKRILKIRKDNYALSLTGRIFVVGGGKAVGAMAEELEKIIKIKNITAGIVNCNSDSANPKKIKVIKANHPLPSQKGVLGVKNMLALKNRYAIGKNDIVICLISGGGSALMPYPADEISLKDKQKITELLLNSGADIKEINTVRKHLSKIKGGQFGKFFSPAMVMSIIISDVIGDDLKTIASGITAPDYSTFKHTLRIIKKYNLHRDIPQTAIKHLKNGIAEKIADTPKTLNNCKNYIIGNNKFALKAIFKKAKNLNLKPLIITDKQIGDPAKIANQRAKEILKKKYKNYNCLIIGGETTPKLPLKHGKGGRNQHYAASSILSMKRYKENWTLVSFNSDGSDFLPNIAGAVIDNNSLKTARNKKINITQNIKNYDSNPMLKKIKNSIIITKETETNVGDIIIYILK